MQRKIRRNFIGVQFGVLCLLSCTIASSGCTINCAELPAGELIEFFEATNQISGNSDWPQWRGPHRNGRGTENLPATQWQEGGPEEVWRRNIGPGFAGVIVQGDRLFTSYTEDGNEYLFCLQTGTGEEQWRFLMNTNYAEQYGDGPRSTPAVANGVVYAMGSIGILYAVNSGNGNKIWQRDVHKKAFGPEKRHNRGHCSSPVVHGDLVVVNGGLHPQNTVLAINKFSGEIVWVYQNGRGAFSSPVIWNILATEQVVCNIAAGIVGLSLADGEQLWHYPWETDFGLNITMPLLFEPSYVFLSSGYDKGAIMLHLSHETDYWKVKPVWTNDQFRNHFNSSVSHHGFIYGFDNRLLKCINARTGAEQWKKRGFRKGSLVIAGNKIWVLGEQGKLAMIAVNPDKYHELGSTRVLTDKCWTAPTLANGFLYLRNQKELICLRL